MFSLFIGFLFLMGEWSFRVNDLRTSRYTFSDHDAVWDRTVEMLVSPVWWVLPIGAGLVTLSFPGFVLRLLRDDYEKPQW